MGKSEDRLLNEVEAAEFLGISRRTMLDLRKDPESGLPWMKVGMQYRYSRDALMEWARENASRSAKKALRRQRPVVGRSLRRRATVVGV